MTKEQAEIKYKTLEDVTTELSRSREKCEIELLKHYLLNYILYKPSQSAVIKKKLLRIGILLEKCKSMKKTMKTSKYVNPKKKFKINSEKQKERTRKKEDYNIE